MTPNYLIYTHGVAMASGSLFRGSMVVGSFMQITPFESKVDGRKLGLPVGLRKTHGFRHRFCPWWCVSGHDDGRQE